MSFGSVRIYITIYAISWISMIFGWTGLSTGKGHSRFANVLLTWGGTVTVIIAEL